ncbi:MAG: putative enzyme [Promethearchaeota archaeon]|nr:MAG: putative enzyme [Candidatus Lokiarchaeota archaeon]
MNASSPIPELLAPVQDWKTLKFVGTIPDSIYFGVNNYNMRKKAHNFRKEELSNIVTYCHTRTPPMKAYLCTNILIYNSELEEIEELFNQANIADIDGVIVHDIAAIQLAKRYKLNLHISTQANISNIVSAQFYEQLGAERIILARELSLNQIKEIKCSLNTTKVECFVHGAMCTSISGRCYFSATIRDSEHYSANRGNCIQPCRRKWRVIDDQTNEFIYDGQMFLNAKDLCMIEYIPELLEAQIDVFKIEGRMKDPLYVKTVSSCYKEAIESYLEGTFTQEKVTHWLKELSKVHNRGFHTGFYFQNPTPENIELTRRGNISPYKKQYIGKVLNFHTATKTAEILIEKRDIEIQDGDEFIIENSNTFIIEKFKNLLFEGNPVNSIKRTNGDPPISLNISLTSQISLYLDQKIYKIRKSIKSENL